MPKGAKAEASGIQIIIYGALCHVHSNLFGVFTVAYRPLYINRVPVDFYFAY